MCQNGTIPNPRSTAEAIAREVGVSERTVNRAEKFSKGIDALGEVSKEAVDKVLRGGSGVTKATIMELPRMEPEKKDEVAKAIISNIFCPCQKRTHKKEAGESSLASGAPNIRRNKRRNLQAKGATEKQEKVTTG